MGVGMSLCKKVESRLHVKDKHGLWTEYIWKNEPVFHFKVLPSL